VEPDQDRQELSQMMGYYGGDWGVREWLAMSAMMIVFWGSVVAVAIWAVRSFARGDQRIARGDADPIDVLAERYARGDNDDDEFQRRRELLHSTRGVTR
jgi:putative membrane protein